MSNSSKKAPKPVSTPLSIRAQIYSHELLGNKDSQPLVSFRLPASWGSTFAELAASALERYERSHPDSGPKATIGAVLDEKNCYFDMAGPVDILQPNEFVRFVLAKPFGAEKVVPSSQISERSLAFSEDGITQPSPHSATKTTTKNGSKVLKRTAPSSRAQPQTPRAKNQSSDPIGVGANGTLIPPKDDELEITGACSLGSQSEPSPAASIPPMPAVKSVVRLRSKPTSKAKPVPQQLQNSRPKRTSEAVNSKAGSGSNRATTQPTGPSRPMARARSQPPSDHSAPETPRQGQSSAAVPGNGSAQMSRKGNGNRQDPYEIPSDSEVDELPKPTPPVKVTPKSGVRSATSAKREASTIPKSAQPYVGEPAPQKTVPETPVRQIVGSMAKTTSGSHRGTPQPVPQDTGAVPSTDGSKTDESRPSIDDSITNESRRRTLEQIAEGATIVSLSDSKSQSDDEASEAQEDVFAPIHPSNKVIGKRSHHAVNNHVNIVDQRELQSRNEASTRPVLIRNSRGVIPVYRKGAVPVPFAPERDNLIGRSSEVSADGASDIPARLPSGTPVKAPGSTPTTSQAQAVTPRFDNSSPNAGSSTSGVAHRRITRLMSGSSATRPNYRIPGIREMAATQERAAGGTPSKLAKRSEIASDEGPAPEDRTASRMETTDISVELPTTTPEKRAEYEVISPEGSPADTPHPLKSFGEINGDAFMSEGTPQPHKGAEEDGALDYVLRESPKWLNDVTQVEQQETSKPRSTKRRREETISSPPVVGTQEPGMVHGGGILSPERPPSGAAQPLTTPAPQPAKPALTAGHSGSREVQGSKKRKHADTADEVVPTPSQQQQQQHSAAYNVDKTKKPRKRGLGRRRRQRLRKRLERQRADGSHHGSAIPAPGSTTTKKKRKMKNSNEEDKGEEQQ
ncbi:hypothetical protein DL770_008800 [Monosporascus sp. CRB-9-2]|nr:hypothetical protein DL770_008800 [Monosporascus sp. CRB-9-2]